ncbi:ankyrin repeat protein [Colletotrichum scovillei]|uniref:Ankyrin repeat protein n=1 Tax=Colletotrichum scovillei TaxID=1209932 RepID=A0A9P7R610_9PEZI|nr:ankyrin repeat protein [Colletotrichum scovillei]KAG7068146.1 ankyrin repeat protein [Colletotrichum scovillei]
MPVRQKSWGLPVRPPDRTATIKADENELEQQSSEAAVKYWLSEAEKLQPEQRLFERGAEADSYEDYVSDLTRAVQNTTNSSKVSRLSRKMKPVYALVKSVAPLVASADQASPFPSSLVIGGITCILSASNRVDDYQGKLIEKMEEMVDEIDSINQYRREGIFQDDPGIKACELNLATDIFQFCVRVAPIFYDEKGKERNGLSVAMKMQFKDFDTKFGDIMAHFKQHLRALENRRGLINNRWTKETHFGVKEMGLFMGKNSQDKKEAMEEKLRQQKQDEDNERAQRRKEFLDWLPFIDFGEFHDNAFERSVDGTGDWLTKNNNYKAWSDSSSSSMLWIRGKHGSGKSHLASCIIEKLLLEAKTAPGNAVAFVYCTTTQSKTEMTLNNLLGSLLRQICRQLPPSRDVKDLISKDDYSSKDSPRRSELKSGILKAISACHASSIIVDGLDECSKLNDSHFKEFCDFIASLVEKSGAVTKVIVLSRPNYGEIDKIMGNVSYIIDVDTGANHDDIERFVSQTISEINSESSQEELQDFEEIKSKLVNNASGMFLYVRLKVRDFGDLGNAEDIRASLEDTVEDLNDLYGQAINSVLEKRTPFRERALMALMWITNSRRPLSKMELLEALSLKLKRNGIRSSQRLKSDYQICRQCADLITETGGFYYLIHGSLEDYLLSNSVGLSEYRALQSQAHAIIAEACLSYLNFDDFQKNHVTIESNDGTTPLIEAVDSGELKFVREILAKIADVARDPSRASPLNWKTQPENLHRHELIDHSRHNGENAFLLSCALGPGSMVELLLQHGANIKALNANSGGETGLHLACTEGHIDVVDVFLSRCEAPELVNAEDFEGYTPLYKTIFCQDLVIAIKLLEHGAQPNHVIRNKYTPLMLSIFGGAYEIAKALIVDYKVDALSQTHYDTPLHWAADVGWSQILKIIPNMSIWYQNQHRKHTPLHEAARQNQIEFMKEFIGLTSTANLIPLDESGGTPLHTAARGGALDAWQAISTSATYTAAHPFGTPVKVDMKTSSSIFLNRMPT